MAVCVWTGATSTDPTLAANYVGLAAPITGDTVQFGNGTGALNNPVTWTADSIVYGVVNATGFTAAMTINGVALKCSGSVTLPSGVGGTFVSNATSSLVLSGTGTVTSSGKSLPQTTTINAAGFTVTQGDAWTLAGTTSASLTVTAGGYTTGNFNVNTGQFASANSNVRSITLGTSTVTCVLGSVGWAIGTTTNLTLSAASSTIVLSGSTPTFTSGASAGPSTTYGTVQLTGSGVAAVNGGGTPGNGNTFANLTRTGTNAKTDALTINAGTVTVTGTLTYAGNTVKGANRVLVQSNTVGTQRTITATGATVAITGDVDFMDIAITGSPTWTNASACFVGDCGGNGSLVTTNATVSATQTCSAPAANVTWSTFAWSGAGGASRVPLPQDDVVLTGNFGTSHTVTADMPRLGRSIDWTGATFTTALTFTLANAVTTFGSLTLLASLTFSGAQTWTFGGRSANTLTTHGVAFPGTVNINAPTGTISQQDALTVPSTGPQDGWVVSGGTWTTNNNSIDCGLWNFSPTNTKTMNLGTSTITVHATGVVVTGTSAGTTLNGSSATVVIGDSSASSKTLTGLGVLTALPTFSYTNAGTGTLIVSATSPCTLGLNISGAQRTVTFTHGVTYTFATAAACTLKGVGAGSLLAINSDSAGNAATFSCASGFVTAEAVSLADNTATGGATFSAMGSTISGGSGAGNPGTNVTGWNGTLNDTDTSTMTNTAATISLNHTDTTNTADAVSTIAITGQTDTTTTADTAVSIGPVATDTTSTADTVVRISLTNTDTTNTVDGYVPPVIPGPVPTAAGLTSRTLYRLVIVDAAGRRYGSIIDMHLDRVDWELNAFGSLQFHLPTTHPAAAVCIPGQREAQLWYQPRGAPPRCIWWGPIVSREAQQDGRTDIQCNGLLWYLSRIQLGPILTNYLTDPDFEDPALANWTAVGATKTSETTIIRKGTRSLKLVSAAAGADSYAYQQFTYDNSGGLEPVAFFVRARCYLPSAGFLGPALQERGLFVQTIQSGVVQQSVWTPINSGVPLNQWVEIFAPPIAVPTGTVQTVQVRLYSPGGTVYWDSSIACIEESTGANTVSTYADLNTILANTLVYAQDTTKNKPNLHIAGPVPGVFGLTLSRQWQFYDHGFFWDAAIKPLVDAGVCDIDIVWNTAATTRTLIASTQKGIPKPWIVLQLGGNAAIYTHRQDASVTAGAISVLSQGMQAEQRLGQEQKAALDVAYAVDTAANGGIVFDEVLSATPEATLDAMTGQAAVELARRKNLATGPSWSCPADPLLNNGVDTGDTITFRGTWGWVVENSKRRIVLMTLVPEQQNTLVVQGSTLTY